MTFTAIPAYAQTMTHEGHRHGVAQAQAVTEFATAVNRYVELHRLLEDPMSCLTWGNDLEQTARASEAHRKAIVEARIATPRGDIFTPRVAAYLRYELLIATDHGRMPEADWTQAALARLPVLPNELEYRFVDRDLVLLDTETLLVVDILEHALPPQPTAGNTAEDEVDEMCAPEAPPVMKGSPCDAHHELEMCWS
jgi:hypothetical protein